MNIVLGTVQFGMKYGVTNNSGCPSDIELRNIFNLAHNSGIERLDTAPGYGSAQHRINALGANRDFKLQSKITLSDCSSDDLGSHIRYQVASILKDLEVDSIDTILIHDAENVSSEVWSSALAVLKELKSDKIINDFGLSVYHIAATRRLVNEGTNNVYIQCPVSIFNPEFIESGELDRLKDLGCITQGRSIFHQGLALSESWPKKFAKYEPIQTEYQALLKKLGIKNIEFCINYLKQTELIDEVVIGVSSLKELEEIVMVGNTTITENVMTDETLNGIKYLLDETFKDPSKWSVLS